MDDDAVADGANAGHLALPYRVVKGLAVQL
jgi:hypothetical protein